MNSDTREVLENFLIPDLINIIDEYTITPYVYFRLINADKKYTYPKYLEFMEEYQMNISREIYSNYKTEQKMMFNQIMEEIEKEQKINNLSSNQKKLEIEIKYIKSIDNLLNKYVELFIFALKEANIFETDHFIKISNNQHNINGTQLYEYFVISNDKRTPININLSFEKNIYYSKLEIKQKKGKRYKSVEYSEQEIESILWRTYIDIIRENSVLESMIKKGQNNFTFRIK